MKRFNSVLDLEGVYYRRLEASERGVTCDGGSITGSACDSVMRDEPPLGVLIKWQSAHAISDCRYFLLDTPPAGLPCTESLTLKDFQQRARELLQGRKSAMSPAQKFRALLRDPDLAGRTQRATY